MIPIKIGEKEYQLRQNCDDLKLGDYPKLMEILNLREYKKRTIRAHEKSNEEEIEEVIEQAQESAEFKLHKMLKLVCFMGNIEESLFANMIPSQLRKMMSVFEPIININLNPENQWEIYNGGYRYEINGKLFYINNIDKWTFQEFADADYLLQQKTVERLIPLLMRTSHKMVYSKYSMWQDFTYTDKVALAFDLPLSKCLGMLYHILEQINQLKSELPYIFSDGGGSGVNNNPNYKRFCKDTGWEHTIITTAESGVFGKLDETRNTNVLIVMDYLNIKIGADNANYEDMKIQQKIQSQK